MSHFKGMGGKPPIPFGRYEGRDVTAVTASQDQEPHQVETEPKKRPAKPERQKQWTYLQTAQHVADFLEIHYGQLVYELFSLGLDECYTSFEIPKRTGGMRRIDAPTGIIRTAQETLAPRIAALYEPHPNAHGFLKGRNIVSNAELHVGQRHVLNVDLKDFFPSVNFGRVRGIFLAAPFGAGPAAATILAKICTFQNSLPQGAPTSPVLSNLAAVTLDRRLSRLARENGVRYARYADDITFSTGRQTMPSSLVSFIQAPDGKMMTIAGPGLERAIELSGFAINTKKVRLQGPHERQSVTGLVVNDGANVTRQRVRRVRAMLHAWRKFGLGEAGREHFEKYRKRGKSPGQKDKAFRNIIYGELAFIKMVKGKADPVFLKLCAQLLDLDPNPSAFVKQMVFGAADYEVFISHASEDKESIARPIFEACEKLGVKVFLDEEHIGWGESFTKKINTALGSARTILCIVSSHSVSKEWPIQEMNAALAFDVSGEKTVVPLMVGRPNLSQLPLLAARDFLEWSGDADIVAHKIRDVVKQGHATTPPAPSQADLANNFQTGPWNSDQAGPVQSAQDPFPVSARDMSPWRQFLARLRFYRR